MRDNSKRLAKKALKPTPPEKRKIKLGDPELGKIAGHLSSCGRIETAGRLEMWAAQLRYTAELMDDELGFMIHRRVAPISVKGAIRN